MTRERPRALLRDASDLLRVDGADALDLFHRIAASDVRTIGEGGFGTVVFTDDKGRMIDAPTMHRRPGYIALICGPTRGPETKAWIEKWVITEDVTLRPLEETVIEVLAENPLERSTFVVQAERVPEAFETIDLDAWRKHFVAAGIVVAGPALAAGPNPLEIGWHEAIGWTKGCYIGQEVVARLDTYDKVKRQPAVVTFEGSVAPGAALRIGAKKVGMVLDALDGRAVVVIDKSVGQGTALDVDGATGATVESINTSSAQDD